MSGTDNRLSHRARRRLRAVKAVGQPPCWRCGGAIDYAAPSWAPDSYDLDELIPRYQGGDPLDPDNVLPAHARCNRSAGGRAGAAMTNGTLPIVDPEPRPVTAW